MYSSVWQTPLQSSRSRFGQQGNTIVIKVGARCWVWDWDLQAVFPDNSCLALSCDQRLANSGLPSLCVCVCPMSLEWFFLFKIVKKWKGGYFVAWVSNTKFKFVFIGSFIGVPTSVLCVVCLRWENAPRTVACVSGPLQETATTPELISWSAWHLQASPAEQQPRVSEPLILTAVQHSLHSKSILCLIFF